MRKTNFYNEGFYHIYNRGVDKRNIFLDEYDRKRFLSSIIKFNVNEVDILNRSPLVKVIAFCLMDNHYHLLLQQISEMGISKLMQRLGTGYTLFFNKKDNRSGCLFEGPFKSVEISSQAQYMHISRYIHLNSIQKSDRNDAGKVREILENYRWSSYRHYLGIDKLNFVDEKPVMNMFSCPREYSDFVLDWVEAKPREA